MTGARTASIDAPPWGACRPQVRSPSCRTARTAIAAPLSPPARSPLLLHYLSKAQPSGWAFFVRPNNGAPTERKHYPLSDTIVTHLNTPQLAARWHVTVGHLQNLRSAGIGPAYVKIGARVLYTVAAIEAYEAARTIDGAA
jgi:hypothetical protein